MYKKASAADARAAFAEAAGGVRWDALRRHLVALAPAAEVLHLGI